MSVPFVTAYETGLLAEFFAHPPHDFTSALSLSRPAVGRDALIDALRTYAAQHGAPPAVLNNIEKLANPNTRAVVTGQQTGLLLGPGYTASKTATAIRLANEYDSEDTPVVPIFWLATQDHDTAEIDHAAVMNQQEQPQKLSVALPAGTMAGRITLPASEQTRVLHEFAAATNGADFGAETQQFLRDSGEDATFASWFARQLFHLFGEHGLIIIDPLIPEIAALTRPIIENELAEPTQTAEFINVAGERLQALGYEPTLGRGTGATNLFVEVLEHGRPQRVALKYVDDTLVVGERTVTAEQLLERFANDPTCITPAAGLRPIVQDFILPTAMFVVGPGEIRYVAQLRGVYDHHNVAMPAVVRRPLLTFVEPAPVRLLTKLELDAYAFQHDAERIAERLALAQTGVEDEFYDGLKQMIDLIERQKELVLQLDPTLVRPVGRAGVQAERALMRLRRQAARSALRRDEQLSNDITRLRNHLLPFGGPSERVYSVWSHIAKFGVKPVVRAYVQAEPTGDQIVLLDR